MKKNLNVIAATFLVTMIVFTCLLEIQKGNARANAIDNLKGMYSQLKDSQSRIVATVEANAIINQNKSWFGFSNSSAQMWDGEEDYSPDMSWVGNWSRSSPNATTSWGYYNPVTGEFTEGR